MNFWVLRVKIMPEKGEGALDIAKFLDVINA